MRCTVLTASRSQPLGDGLTYEVGAVVPAPGLPVRVPLRTSFVEGIVLDVFEDRAATEFDLKEVRELLSDRPLLSEAQIRTLRWMAKYYHCSLRHALGVWLPAPPWNRLLPQKTRGYRINTSVTEITVRGVKQKAVIDFLRGKEWASKEEIVQETDVGPSVLQGLFKKGIVIREDQRQHASETITAPGTMLHEPQLSSLQQSAYEVLRTKTKPSLLFGVTGSGKTEVYAKMIADAVRAGKQSLLLVPEILLTEYCIDRFLKLLPENQIAVVHSRMTQGERRAVWKRIFSGNIWLVIGSRSALFSPLQKLGLIIIDEEHEWTYKNEQMPRYHARETAEVLARESGAKLVLGTATPSLESWSRVQSGRFAMARLPERFGNHPLPTVQIIDLAEVTFGSLYPFSPPLLEAIEKRLVTGEQSILFLNRRGTASALLCLDCRRRVVSPHSQLPFTVHHRSDGTPYLLDHTTGVFAAVPTTCPHCCSLRLLPIGAGTQKIEHLLQKKFPKARILRADSDTLEDAAAIRHMLSSMRERKTDILVGTQSIVKGLDLPEVTLAAVLLADIGLSLPHFRAGERIFQLLSQLAGRSGRAKPGEVIIQTFRPDAPEIRCAAMHATEQYLKEEWNMRVYTKYPPASTMLKFILRGDGPELRAHLLLEKLKPSLVGTGASITAAPAFFGGGKTWHVFLRGYPESWMLPALPRDVLVDVDPMDCV